jgi:hypothetical protein
VILPLKLLVLLHRVREERQERRSQRVERYGSLSMTTMGKRGEVYLSFNLVQNIYKQQALDEG